MQIQTTPECVPVDSTHQLSLIDKKLRSIVFPAEGSKHISLVDIFSASLLAIVGPLGYFQTIPDFIQYNKLRNFLYELEQAEKIIPYIAGSSNTSVNRINHKGIEE